MTLDRGAANDRQRVETWDIVFRYVDARKGLERLAEQQRQAWETVQAIRAELEAAAPGFPLDSVYEVERVRRGSRGRR